MPKRKKSFDNNKQALQARSGTFIASLIRLSVLAGVAVIVLIAFFVYLPCINGGFVLDDTLLLAKNDLIRNPDGLRKLWCTTVSIDYWPMTNTSFWIEWRLWGMNSTGYHVTNLILHIVETLLICIILRKLSIPGAFLAAMLFAMHPVNVETVAWIASRKNMLAMLFFLLSILWYLKADIPAASVGMAPARSRGGSWEREQTFSSFILYPFISGTG
jgi:protein O-mannosyl-transferase